jgi:diguanylate cyclase (GGDEF)-like protein/hemerythrin-like metal-binding protein/PAS domain S-box-containing protein
MTSQFLKDRNIDILFSYQTDMFWIIRLEGTILRVNDAVTETLGYDVNEMKDRPLNRFIHPDDFNETREVIERLSKGEIVDTFTNRCRHHDGTYRVFDWKAGRHHGLIFASARDVTSRAEREQRLYDEASRDPLTGLYNRRYFYDNLEKAEDKAMTLAIIDLDHFKLVNDMWGHQTGDRVLTSLARELTKHADDDTLVSRIGGEEFALLFKQGIDDVRGKLRELKNVIARARFPVVKHVTVSVGFAQKQENESIRGWFKRADDAMYVAKEQGRNTVVEATTDIPILTSKFSEWDPSWSSGNATIDRQHKNLLFLGKQLVYTTYPDKTRGHIEEEVQNIIREVRQHFETEERLLEKAGYPALDEHKNIHFDLLQKALHIQTLFETGKIDAMTVFSFLIEDFIMNHLLREDIKYFDYIPKEDTAS